MASKVDPILGEELDRYLRDLGEAEFSKVRQSDNAKLAVLVGKELVFAEYLSKQIAKLFKGGVPAVLKAKKPPKAKTIKRVLNLMISDTHYQSLLDPRETGVSYGSIEEARRTASVFDQAVNYKTEHRDETGIICHSLGDLIQGQLHDARDGAPVAQQCMAAIHIWSQAIKYLSENFGKVLVPVQTGNHGRRKDRHPGRATFQKWDSNEYIIMDAVRQIAYHAGWNNVEFQLPLTPYYKVKALGHDIFGTHGDTVLNFGNPYKSINVANITNQINKIIAAEVARGDSKTEVVVGGHVHIASLTYLPCNNVKVFTNAALIPPDNFSNSIGSFDSTCGQWMFETTEAHAVGDTRLIEVDSNTDQQAWLDTIISPFQL